MTILTTALVFLATAHAAGEPARAGNVASITGDAPVAIESASGERREAQATAPIYNGDKITTTLRQAARLRFDDSSELVIGPGSSLVIEQAVFVEPRQTTLELVYGITFAWVRKAYGAAENFAIKTKTGVMGVRGTQFVTEWHKASSSASVHTFEGKVRVARELGSLDDPGASVIAGPGETTAIGGSGRPPVVAGFDVAAYRRDLKKRNPLFAQAIDGSGGKADAKGETAAAAAGAGAGSDYSLSFPNGLSPKKKKPQ